MHVIKWYCSYLKYRQQMGVTVKVVFRKRLFITVQPYTVTGPKIVHIVNCMILS